ncbi:hypothetical protein B0H13DRAFT_790714 [Mycena leptocephala]|nr:hypothetical protein B0H13DRAFT_790714 [Mycena leptocephala]
MARRTCPPFLPHLALPFIGFSPRLVHPCSPRRRRVVVLSRACASREPSGPEPQDYERRIGGAASNNIARSTTLHTPDFLPGPPLRIGPCFPLAQVRLVNPFESAQGLHAPGRGCRLPLAAISGLRWGNPTYTLFPPRDRACRHVPAERSSSALPCCPDSHSLCARRLL